MKHSGNQQESMLKTIHLNMRFPESFPGLPFPPGTLDLNVFFHLSCHQESWFIYHLLTQENIITKTMVESALSVCLLCAKDMSHHHTEWHQQTCKVTLGIRWETWAFKNLTIYLGLYLVADLILKFGVYSSKTTIFLECCMTAHPLRGCLMCYFQEAFQWKTWSCL